MGFAYNHPAACVVQGGREPRSPVVQASSTGSWRGFWREGPYSDTKSSPRASWTPGDTHVQAHCWRKKSEIPLVVLRQLEHACSADSHRTHPAGLLEMKSRHSAVMRDVLQSSNQRQREIVQEKKRGKPNSPFALMNWAGPEKSRIPTFIIWLSLRIIKSYDWKVA